jgi:transcriptional regulator with XRE-family HTH domain
MDSNQQLMEIRTRKLGILINDARQLCRRSISECAVIMGISSQEFELVERGKKAPSLPQIEALACFLDIPLEHFWGNSIRNSQSNDKEATRNESLRQIRDRFLGTQLRMKRLEQNLSVEDVANLTSIPIENLQLYESGKESIPLPALEGLLRGLDLRLEDIFDQNGPVGKWRMEKRYVQQFLQLPPKLQQFVAKPVNIPYLELAIRLNDLSVDKLRNIAEGLLEITY